MSFAKRLSLLALSLALVGIIVIFCSPVLVSNGLRVFLWWKARHQNLKIEYQKIEAPFLKPVVIHNLRVTNARPCVFHIDISAPRAMFALNLRGFFLGSNARILHQVSIDALHCEIRRDPRETAECNFDWNFLHRLLADQVQFNNVDLRFVSGATDFALRGGAWTASEIESGNFIAHELRISTPLFRENFSDLRGATKWENDHLTLGALSLMRGVDIETITIDFSRLEKKRIGIELNLDAFGGKVRASIASENRDKGILWNVAGSASSISLSQMSTALGLHDTAGGSVRASKFTFRGDTQNLAHVTASIWTELSDFTWRDRVAETVMIGASLYNQQIEVEQVYVKQRNNQLTLNGEYALPTKTSDWINPNFRGDISASIADLGEFAKLFGGTTKDFAGELAVTGTVNGRDRNFAGQIMVEGSALRVWAAPLDSVRAKFTLKNAQLNLDSLQARHHDDFFNATGEINLARNHRYSFKANTAVANLTEYLSFLPENWRALQPQGRASVQWEGHGTAEAHSGDFKIQTEGLRLTTRWGLQPFDLKLDGAYSPQNIFFREFHFANPKAELSAFVTVASDHLQLQKVRFDLNGKPMLQGEVFVPLAVSRWWSAPSLDDFDRKQNFSIDLTLDQLDLAELQNALTERTGLAGKIQGQLQTYGPIGALAASCEMHLRDFAWDDSRRISAEFNANIASDILKMMASMNAAGASSAKLEAALPLARATFFAYDKPIDLKFAAPAMLLAKVPSLLTGAVFSQGIFSSNLTASGTLLKPNLNGNISCLNARMSKPAGSINGIDGQVDFRGSSAAITFANLDFGDARLPFHGTADFSDLANISLKLIPDLSVYELTPAITAKCIDGVQVLGSRRTDFQTIAFPELEEVELRGDLTHAGQQWTITLATHNSPRPRESFSLCQSDGDILRFTFAVPQKTEFGPRALHIFRGDESRSSNFKLAP